MTALSKSVKRDKNAAAKAEVRERLVRASRTLLAEEGPSALRVRRIAALADRTTMCIYSHFGGKDGILEELYRRGFAELEDRLAALLPDDGLPGDDPAADLRAMARAYRGFALDEPALYGLMFERAGSMPAGPVESLPSLVAAVRRCIEAGAVVSDDPEAVAYLLLGAAHGLVSIELTHPGGAGRDGAEVLEASIDALLRGLAPARS